MSDKETSNAVQVSRAGNAAILTIDRQEAGNSISLEVVEALRGFLDDAAGDDDLRAVVITGAGERYFAAGGDLKRYRELRSREQLRSTFERARRLLDEIELFPRPVIAAVNGWALGGGAELMLACDLRVMDAAARIGFPYVKLSLMPGWHGSERLVAAVGGSHARNLLLRGAPVHAERALAIGLVHEVAPAGQALERALAVAAEFDTLAPLSMGAIKRVLRAVERDTPGHLRAVADSEFEDLWMSEDHREGEAAFAEKREARFRGR